MLLIRIFIFRLWFNFVRLVTSESTVVKADIEYHDLITDLLPDDIFPGIAQSLQLLTKKLTVELIVCRLVLQRTWFGLWNEQVVISTGLGEDGKIYSTFIIKDESSFTVRCFLKEDQVIPDIHQHYIGAFNIDIKNKYWWYTRIPAYKLMVCSEIEKFLTRRIRDMLGPRIYK